MLNAPPSPTGGHEQLCACVYDKKISLLFVAIYVIIYYFFAICFVGRCNYSLVIKYETAEDSSGRDLISLQQENSEHATYMLCLKAFSLTSLCKDNKNDNDYVIISVCTQNYE